MSIILENYIKHIDLGSPEFEKRTKVHDWRNYVPENWIKNWGLFTHQEKQIIATMAEMQAEGEEWD